MRRDEVDKALKMQKLDAAIMDAQAIIDELRISILVIVAERGSYRYIDCFRGSIHGEH